MAKIVGVHGVGHQFMGENTLRAEWLPALKDGLARSGLQLASDMDSPARSMETCSVRRARARQTRRMMRRTWMTTGSGSSLSSGGEKPRVSDLRCADRMHARRWSVPSVVQRALDALSQSPFFAGLGERALIYDLKQVRRYLREPDIRRRGAREGPARHQPGHTRDRGTFPRFGRGVYRALCSHPDWPVRVFVTLGSPLGIRNVIFEALDPAPRDGTGVWPTTIQHWVNIADSGDVVALIKELASCFGSRVVDHLIDNGAKAHDATRYLATQELGNAVAIGL